MIRAGVAHSTHIDSAKAAEAASRQAMDHAGISKASVTILFSTIDHAPKYQDVLKVVRKITKAPHVIGASGYGVITERIEIERRPAIGVMVLELESIEAQSFLVPNLQESSFRAGQRVAESLQHKDPPPSLMLALADTFSFQSASFFDGFEETWGYIPIIGGTAAEDGAEEKTYQMRNHEVAFDAVAGLTLSGQFRSEMGLTQSCQPFGEPFRVTRANGNTIYEIEGRPAYDMLLESLTEIEFENPHHLFQRIFLGLPTRDFQTDFTRSNYLIRNITGVNAKKGVLTCVTPVEAGDIMTFTVRDAERARHDLLLTLRDLKERFGSTKPAFGFYFNCCARGEALYDRLNEDTKFIRQFFPDVPILGIFAYGELSPVDHVNHLHHYSGALTLVSES